MTLASFEITDRDPQWRAWLEYLDADTSQPQRAADARAAGRLTAFGSKWPENAKRPPVIERRKGAANG